METSKAMAKSKSTPPVLLRASGLCILSLLVISCGIPNKWEAHRKENKEPTDPKYEAPFEQNRDPGQDGPYTATNQYGPVHFEKPKVVETFADPYRQTILTGIPVQDRPNFVLSPYAPDQGLVDVTGFPAGTEVRCPYSGQIMRVPTPAIQNPPPSNNLGAFPDTDPQPTTNGGVVPQIVEP
jgi:hypothetical protein